MDKFIDEDNGTIEYVIHDKNYLVENDIDIFSYHTLEKQLDIICEHENLKFYVRYISKDIKKNIEEIAKEKEIYEVELIDMVFHCCNEIMVKHMHTLKYSYIELFICILKCTFDTYNKLKNDHIDITDSKRILIFVIFSAVANTIMGFDYTCLDIYYPIKDKHENFDSYAEDLLFKLLKKMDYVIVSIHKPEYWP